MLRISSCAFNFPDLSLAESLDLHYQIAFTRGYRRQRSERPAQAVPGG